MNGSEPDDELVLENAADHFTAADLERGEIEDLIAHLREQPHPPRQLVRKTGLNRGDVEAFLEWSDRRGLLFSGKASEFDARLYAASQDLLAEAQLRHSDADSIAERERRRIQKRVSVGYLVLIFAGILGGVLLEALGGVDDAGIAGVGVVCPGAMLWLLSLLGVHLYVRWRYGDRDS